jgi:hypothetical protein
MEDFLGHRPLAVSPPSEDNGQYRFTVPPGTYFLVAEKPLREGGDAPPDAGDLFSFHGSNPVTAAAGEPTHVGFSLVPRGEVRREPNPLDALTGTAAGVVLYNGEPLDGVEVHLYADAASNFRGLARASAPPTGRSGAFRLDFIPEGSYFVVARKRVGRRGSGPLTDGDFFGFHPGNPIRIMKGTVARFDLEVISKAGEIGKNDSLFRESDTAIRGVITDGAGVPVPGVYAFVYRDGQMSRDRPSFISRETGPGGDYVLYLPQGGTYYLGARSGYGATPLEGEWYGRYRGTPDHSVTVSPGQVRGEIGLVVERVRP